MIYLVLELLKVGNGKEGDDQDYNDAEGGAGSVSIKRNRDGDEGNEDGGDEQDPKKLKV